MTNTQPQSIDIARDYYDQRARIAEDAGFLERLIEAVNAPNDLMSAQWAQWYSVALGFRPDLIVELGRGKGNSTAIFCQAALRLGGTRVVSLCNSRDWRDETLPRLRSVVPAGWFDPLDARICDILDVDYQAIVKGSQRVLVLWDAHGFEIAEVVLGQILPIIADRPHLVLMHDISDTRYTSVSGSYEGQPLWKGSTWDKGTGISSARVNIGWMNSLQDQVVAVADFAARNDLEIGSADHVYAEFFAAHPGAAEEMKTLLGDTFFSLSGHWAFFTLTVRPPPFHFPAVVQRRFRNRSDVTIRDLHPPRRWFGRSRPLPRVIETSLVPWEYAAVMAVQPLKEIPADAPRSLRLRILVEEAPVGVGLLSADHSTFVQSVRLLPSIDSKTVWLAIDEPATAGPLVVHAWDEPRRGRARIDEMSLVW